MSSLLFFVSRIIATSLELLGKYHPSGFLSDLKPSCLNVVSCPTPIPKVVDFKL